MRRADGTEDPDLVIEEIPWKDAKTDDETSRVIKIDQLARAMKAKLEENKLLENNEFTLAQFALQMIEGVQKVRFVIAHGSN